MPRPKGSKNKKKISTLEQLMPQAEQLRDRRQKLEAEQEKILETIEQQTQRLKETKKQLRLLNKEEAKLQEKIDQANTIDSEKHHRELVEQIITELSTVLPSDVLYRELCKLRDQTDAAVQIESAS